MKLRDMYVWLSSACVSGKQLQKVFDEGSCHADWYGLTKV
eukprot:CAMPEP_0114318220 /NCGR_PEP_ID=MMETSP0059-20121206/24436_1 /TAXON_ID=36894 /ORGANISM="Pyramimonas parkeae, Strain CCMP726" /LENGTH=39 /DNA_ID= /DNA_START= /DNA_END= /DNA_ORIENTATION=